MTLPPTPPEPAPTPRPLVVTGGWWGVLAVGVAISLCLALFIVTGLGRNMRSPPVLLTALTTVLPYLFAGVLAAVFGLWALAPDRKAFPIVLALVLIIGAVLWGPAVASWPEDAQGDAVRVASWNVRRLWGGSDAADPVECVLETLKEIDADVIALQEVSALELKQVREGLDLECVQTDYLRTGDANGGGLAVCVRGDEWTLRNGSPARFSEKHNWHYVFAEVGRGDHVFNMLSVHLQPYRLKSRAINEVSGVSERQGSQSAELLRRVQRFQDPTVLAGDFNSTRDAAIHVSIRDSMADAFEAGGSGFGSTFQLMGWLPIRIDHVYVSDAFAVSQAKIPTRDCSDHRPVVTDLTLRAAPTGTAGD
ncbi:MAG: endonuclease/exonuclease/phosphatase family protein [Myxococcota bacterium]